ncbi:MAG: hypothetical protein HYU57_01995 [Micavibrio aeruginosavorus]|nr:hypothetical protein [Micavibrio aeruginosavorus]
MTFGVASLPKFLRGTAATLSCLAAFGIQAAFAESDPVQAVQESPDAHAEAMTHGVADAAHGAADAAHGSGGLPQFDPSDFASQIFWLAIAFGLMYLIFSKKTLPTISGVIENRREQIKSDRDTAESLKNEAESVLHAYERGLEAARGESARINAAAVEEGKKQAEIALKAFQDKTEQQMNALESSLAAGKQQAMDEMNTIAAEIASAAAEKIVGISTDLNQAKNVVQSINKLSKAA